MEENQRGKSTLATTLTTGLIAGVIAAAINICYMFLYESITGFSMDRYINILSISISSIVPGAIAGLLFFALIRNRGVSKAKGLFISITVILALLSFIGPLSNELPDGTAMPAEFVGLTLPMHIIAPFVYIIMLVRSVSSDR